MFKTKIIMKRILTIAASMLALFVLFASCDKDKNLTIEGKWKVVSTDPEQADIAAYMVIENGTLTIGAPVSLLLRELTNLPVDLTLAQYKDYLVIVANGTYTIEKTSKTSGKLKVTMISDNPEFPIQDEEMEITFSNLTKESATISAEIEIAGKLENYSATLTIETQEFKTMTLAQFWGILSQYFG